MQPTGGDYHLTAASHGMAGMHGIGSRIKLGRRASTSNATVASDFITLCIILGDHRCRRIANNTHQPTVAFADWQRWRGAPGGGCGLSDSSKPFVRTDLCGQDALAVTTT